LPAIGLHSVTKYRVQPNFYQTNTVETLNLASWKSLNQAQKDLLNRIGIEFEVTSVQYVEAVRLEEEKIIQASGIKDIVLKGAAKAKYLEIAHGEIWKELKSRSKYHDQLRPLLYKPGHANRQLVIGQELDMKR
jgi:TRAP-type C4-dicarboxylate transport system substrate-binding protein